MSKLDIVTLKIYIYLYIIPILNWNIILTPFHVLVVSQTDVFKYMLLKPMIHGQIGKWMIALTKFSLQYVLAKAVKGQVLADFLIEHQNV